MLTNPNILYNKAKIHRYLHIYIIVTYFSFKVDLCRYYYYFYVLLVCNV